MAGEPVTAWERTNEFISVEKTIEEPDQTEGLVIFTITSTCDEPIAFRIADELPATVSPSAVGFHPEYKFDNWTLYEDNRITLTDAIAPGETLFAFYYLEATLSVPLAQLGPPTIEETLPTTPEAVTADEPPEWSRPDTTVASKNTINEGPLPAILTATSDAATVRSTVAEPKEHDEVTVQSSPPLSDHLDGEPAPLDTDKTRGCDETAPLDGHDPVQNSVSEDDVEAVAVFEELEAEYDSCEYVEFGDDVERYYPSDISFEELLVGDEPDNPQDNTDSDGGDPAAGAESPEVDQFQWGVDQDETDPSQEESVLTALVRELDQYDPSEAEVAALRKALGVDTSRHTTVKIRHLQSQVTDLTAYIDALEAFLDENGTAAELLATVEDDLNGIHDRLDQVEASVDDTRQRQTDLQERLEALEHEVAASPDVRTAVEQVREESAQIGDRLSDIERQLDTTSSTLEDAVTNHRDRLTTLEEKLAERDDDYETLRKVLQSTASELSQVSHPDR